MDNNPTPKESTENSGIVLPITQSKIAHKNKIILLEVIVSILILLLIGYLVFQNTKNSIKVAEQTKTVSPAPIVGNFGVIIKENPTNKSLIDVYLKDKKTGKENFFKTLLNTEYALNAEKSLLAFSDYPAIFDGDTRKEYIKSGKKINLMIYDLKNKTSKVIASSSMNMFHPIWENSETLTYTNQGSRVSYDIFRRGLSYIVIYTDPGVQIKLVDSSGKSVGESFIEGPIGDPIDPTNQTKASRVLYFAKPPTGIYFAEFSSTNSATISYKTEILLYDKDANLTDASKSGVLKNAQKDVVKINFNQSDSRLSSIQK